MDYLATTECHKIVYPGEKQESTSSDGYQKSCWLSISSPPLQVSFRVAVDFIYIYIYIYIYILYTLFADRCI